MSDIEQLRQDVIDAAYAQAADLRNIYRGQVRNMVSGVKVSIVKACDALDEAMNPDPWKLLADIEESATIHSAACALVEWTVIDEVKAALQQHQRNQKDGAE